MDVPLQKFGKAIKIIQFDKNIQLRFQSSNK